MITALSRLVTERPRAVLACGVMLALIGAWLGATRLRIDSDTDSLILESRPYMPAYRAFLAEFGDLEGAIIAVDPKGRDAEARAAVDFLATRLAQYRVAAFVTPEEQWRLATWSASDAELALLASSAPALADIAAGRESAHPLVAHRLSEPRGREYLRAPGGTLLLIDARFEKRFAEAEPFRAAVLDLRAAVDEARARYPTVDIGLTGKPVLQHDEMATATADMTRASIASLAVIVVLFAVAFRGLRRPLLATIAFLIASAWTYGAATLLVGRLTLLSMVFMLVLVGAGLDYGVHVVSRYGETRRHGTRIDAVRTALVSVGPGMLTGAIASAAVFLLALFGSFGGLRELGVVAAAGLVLCALAMVTVLPALLVLFGDGAREPDRERCTTAAPAAAIPRRPRVGTVVLAGLPILALALPALLGPRFDLNLLNLQSDGLESVHWERRLMHDSAAASWYAVSVADSLEEVAALESRAKEERVILRSESALSFMQPETDARRALRRSIADIAIDEAPAGASAATMAARAIVEGARLPLRDALPAAVRDRMVSTGGRFLVSYFPAVDAWNPRQLGRFVARVRAVDAKATGVPFIQHRSIDDMVKTFLVVSLLAVAAIALVAWIDLRRLGLTALAVGTVLAGVGMTLGTMPLLGVELNLANFFAIPMLIGLGIDSAIHIIHRAREDPARLDRTVRTVGFTALTTAIGFGALVFADHRGMRSLGLVMLVGSLSCMYAACVALPLLLRRTQNASGAPAETNSGSTPSGSAAMNRLP
ncbi:MAG: putative efflux pump, superfamily [Planctomycetota bacterium]|jgi:predicted RND superfamily exporter protein